VAKPKEGFHDFFAQIPEELWQALADEAMREDRSITSHFVHILRQRFPHVAVGQPRAPRGRPRKGSGEAEEGKPARGNAKGEGKPKRK
jgi:hypothetical protein